MSGLFGSTHPIDEVEPADLRHPQIREQHVRRHVLQDVERLLADSAVHRRPGRFEDLPHERERVAVVVDRQNANALRAAGPAMSVPACGACGCSRFSSTRAVARSATAARSGTWRPFPGPSLLGSKMPALELHQVPRDRQAEAEPAALAVDAGVGLPEALEHVGKELRRDADPRVADGDLDVRVRPARGAPRRGRPAA